MIPTDCKRTHGAIHYLPAAVDVGIIDVALLVRVGATGEGTGNKMLVAVARLVSFAPPFSPGAETVMQDKDV